MKHRERISAIRLDIHFFVLAGLLALGQGAARPGLAAVAPETCTTVVDTLGAATPATRFSSFGSGGTTISSFQLPGPAFTLTQPAVINQIGGFVDNCKQIINFVPLCPQTSPLTVQIRPSNNGVPDLSTVLATFVLSHDNDPLNISFESVDVNLLLPAGNYFALFAPQGQDVGFVLGSASNPFLYTAGLTLTGYTQGDNSAFAGPLFEAVRILADCRLQVTIDVKPGSFPNSINPRSRGMIPVAIWTTATFDATTVDPETLRFGAVGTEAAAVHSALEDLDADGDLDLILHFSTQETGIGCDATSASLTGKTYGGQPIAGSDSVRTTGCH
jgi:hypothetical protein